ncbi:MAG: SPOR domain-containing protein [Flavobacteriaceae bacterium]|nr:SPOR domain-containing protein [Flavobacteriaceae bacterium]MDG2314772.1 SPOR domain-containing protein [Flavobacteriaceae bacterium]
MMQLQKHISELLYRYECVTVPGFGAFLTHYKSARLDATQHAFYPPTKGVSFNEQLRSNDGLLAHYIADVYSIAFEEAVKEIHTEVVAWKKALHKGSLELVSLGTFVFNNEQKIVFAPSDSHNHLMSSFGLGAVVSPKIARVAPAVAPHSSATSFWKVAAVGVLAIGIVGLSYFNWENQHLINQEQAAIESSLQKAVFDLGALPSITVTMPLKKERFHIVAGAFRVAANADKKLEQLLQNGYNAKRLPANTYGLHPVAFESFTDKDAAVKRLRTIQKLEAKDAWILTSE